jgi:hypothetical protein
MEYNSDVHTVIYLIMHYPLLVTFVKISPFALQKLFIFVLHFMMQYYNYFEGFSKKTVGDYTMNSTRRRSSSVLTAWSLEWIKNMLHI